MKRPTLPIWPKRDSQRTGVLCKNLLNIFEIFPSPQRGEGKGEVAQVLEINPQTNACKNLSVLVFIVLTIGILVSLGMAADKQSSDCRFKAKLIGNEEVPPVETKAKGEVTFELNKQEDGLIYRLTLTDIHEVTAAHIHAGRKGMNGPPVAPLFTEPKKADISGTLYVEGTITGYELMDSLKGKSLNFLLQMLTTGEAYVNVHSKRHPEGEIRGQIEWLKR
jgi:hypothetical protein